MYKMLKVRNYLNEEIDLTDKNGFHIQNIDGLSAADGIVNESDLATIDGSKINSVRRGSRLITLTVKLKHNVESNRHKLYKYFPVTKKVRLFGKTSNRQWYIDGVVKSNSIPIFDRTEIATIEIVCPDPNLYAVESNETVFFGIEPLFEFPFAIEEEGIELSAIKQNHEQNVFYVGDIETGITIDIFATGSASGIVIYNLNTRESITIDDDKLQKLTGSGIIAGDEIIISTVENNKKITLIRGGETINILNVLGKNTKWFKLSKGDNSFAYVADEGINNLQFKISNKTVYEGI